MWPEFPLVASPLPIFTFVLSSSRALVHGVLTATLPHQLHILSTAHMATCCLFGLSCWWQSSWRHLRTSHGPRAPGGRSGLHAEGPAPCEEADSLATRSLSPQGSSTPPPSPSEFCPAFEGSGGPRTQSPRPHHCCGHSCLEMPPRWLICAMGGLFQRNS